MSPESDSAFVGGESPSGLFGILASMLGSVIRHIQALLSLAGFEAKFATGIIVKGIVFLTIALLMAAFGYVLLIVFVAFALNLAFGINWLWILLGLSVLHFCIVIIAAFRLRSLFRQKLFSATMQELRADIAGLTSRSANLGGESEADAENSATK